MSLIDKYYRIGYDIKYIFFNVRWDYLHSISPRTKAAIIRFFSCRRLVETPILDRVIDIKSDSLKSEGLWCGFVKSYPAYY